jgi:hypothetical protein
VGHVEAESRRRVCEDVIGRAGWRSSVECGAGEFEVIAVDGRLFVRAEEMTTIDGHEHKEVAAGADTSLIG